MAPAYDDLPNVHNAYKALVSPNNSAECDEEAIEVVNEDHHADFDETAADDDDDDASTKSTSNLANGNKQQQQATLTAATATTTATTIAASVSSAVMTETLPSKTSTNTTFGDSTAPVDGESREQPNERENENGTSNEGSDRCETDGMITTLISTTTVPTVMEHPLEQDTPENREIVDANEGAIDRETAPNENKLMVNPPLAETDGTKEMKESLVVAVETVDEESMLDKDQPVGAITGDTEWLNDLVKAHTPSSKTLKEADHPVEPHVMNPQAASTVDVKDVDGSETERNDEPHQRVSEIVEVKAEQEEEPMAVPMQQEASKDAHPVKPTPEVSLEQSPPVNPAPEVSLDQSPPHDPQDDSEKEHQVSQGDAEEDKRQSPPLEVQEEWRELMGDDLIIRTVEAATGDELTSVQPQDAVLVDFVGRLAMTKEEENGPIFHEAKDWLVVIAEKDVVPALEMGIRFMSVGERAVVWSHTKYAYGPHTRKHGDYSLPAFSHVRYEIKVKSIVTGEERDHASFQLRVGTSKKNIGNDVYANEWSAGQGRMKAIQLYKRGAQMLEFIANTVEDDAMRNEAKNVMLQCLNNIVAVNIHAKEYHQAKEDAVKVLTHDPNNYKGLMRAAKAALLDPASSFEEVEGALDAAAQVAPATDAELSKLRSQFKAKKQEYKKKSKAIFTKMGESIAPGKPKAASESISRSEEAAQRNSESEELEVEATSADTKNKFEPVLKDSETRDQPSGSEGNAVAKAGTAASEPLAESETASSVDMASKEGTGELKVSKDATIDDGSINDSSPVPTLTPAPASYPSMTIGPVKPDAKKDTKTSLPNGLLRFFLNFFLTLFFYYLTKQWLRSGSGSSETKKSSFAGAQAAFMGVDPTMPIVPDNTKTRFDVLEDFGIE